MHTLSAVPNLRSSLSRLHFQNHGQHLKNTAGGLDGWVPEDFKYFSPLCFVWIAGVLNAIENGAQWPDGCMHARGAFLAKDPE